MNTVTFPPGYVADPDDPFCGVASVAWGREMGRLRATRPRPLVRRYGVNATDAQKASHAAEERAWSKLYRAAKKAHDACR